MQITELVVRHDSDSPEQEMEEDEAPPAIATFGYAVQRKSIQQQQQQQKAIPMSDDDSDGQTQQSAATGKVCVIKTLSG